MESLKAHTTKVSTNESHQDEVIHEIFEIIKNDAIVSQELLKSNIEDKSIEFFRTLLNDPQKAIAEMSSNIDELIFNAVEELFTKKFKSSKKVGKLFLQSTGKNAIHFYLVLKKDTESTRSTFYDYLDGYDELALSNRVEVHLHFIGDDLASKLKPETKQAF
ncbi:hypothetical protein [Ekhidna sp.]